MVASLANEPLTFDELMSLPDDGNRYEIINGELIVSPTPSHPHQGVVGNLFELVRIASRQTRAGIVRLAPSTVKFSNYNSVEPDLFFVRANRWDALTTQGIVDGAPDIVFEVISPSSASTDRVKKFGLYASNGVPEYWIVDPIQRQVGAHALVEGTYRPIMPNADGSVTSRVLPDLTVNPATCFNEDVLA